MIQFSTQNVGWISAAHPPKPLSTMRLLVDALSLIHPTKPPDYHKVPPVKHGLVNRPSDWPWSSFSNAVNKGWYEASWGAEVPVTITGMDYE